MNEINARPRAGAVIRALSFFLCFLQPGNIYLNKKVMTHRDISAMALEITH
jgi:hypothetical protein